MKSILFTCFSLFLLCTTTAVLATDDPGHREAVKVCKNMFGQDRTTQCLRTIKDALYFEPKAVSVCGNFFGGDSNIDCLKVIRNRRYSSEELSTCESMFGQKKIMECFEVSGKEVLPSPASTVVPTGIPVQSHKQLDRDLVLSSLRKIENLLEERDIVRAKKLVRVLIEGLD